MGDEHREGREKADHDEENAPAPGEHYLVRIAHGGVVHEKRFPVSKGGPVQEAQSPGGKRAQSESDQPREQEGFPDPVTVGKAATDAEEDAQTGREEKGSEAPLVRALTGR